MRSRPDGWAEWGGELMFVAGFTSGGAPYGVRLQDFPPDDLPDALKGLAAERRAPRPGPPQPAVDPSVEPITRRDRGLACPHRHQPVLPVP